MTTLTREQSEKRARLLRAFSDRQFTIVDLLQIFGEAFKAKFREKPTRHQLPGKHFMGRGHEGLGRPPVCAPGTKLLKKWYGKDRIRKALARRAELIQEIEAVEREGDATRMAHGINTQTNRAALLRVDWRGVVAQYDDLKDPRAYGWHPVHLLHDFKLDKPTLVERVTRIVRR